MANQVIANKLRWRNELVSVAKYKYKQFEILNANQAKQTGIAILLLHGPPGSPYEGYSFRVEYNGQQIPFSPPKVKFIDIPWNPFVCPQTGKIYCDIFIAQTQIDRKYQFNGWSPALTLQKVALSLISLLAETELPQCQSGLNIEASAEMKFKYSTFFTTAKQKAAANNYLQVNIYKDQQKPSNFIPEDVKKIDEEFMKCKSDFVQNPQIQIILNKKKGLETAKQFQI